MNDKRKVAVITDSTSDIPLAVREALDIDVVALTINFEDGSSLRDREEISPSEVIDRLRTAKKLPSTAQPTAGQFLEAFQRALDKDLDILCICISSGLSGTLNAAQLAAKDIPEDRIRLVDSRVTTMQLGLLVMHVARAAQTGATLEQLEKLALDTIPKVDTYAALQTLDYAYKGGRIGRASHIVGSALGIKPVVNFIDGVLTPMDKVRTWKRALNRCVDLIPTKGQPAELAILHADNLDEAERVREILAEKYPGVDIHVDWCGPTITISTLR